jgi:HEAT repeat protein
VRALTTRGGSESVAALQWTAGADTNDAVAASAFDGMAQLAARAGQVGADATDALVDLMADPARREIAVATLARAPAGHLDRVVLGLKHEAPAVRRATVDVLTRVKDTEAAAHVRAALDHDDPAVREAAVTALDRVGARGLPVKLAAMASNDPDVTVRRAAGAVLARLSDTEAGGGTLG